MVACRVLRPRRDHRASHAASSWRRFGAAFRDVNGVGSRIILTVSRLHHAACTLPVYASQPRSPSRHATLGSGRSLAFAGQGTAPCGAPRKVSFPSPPFPGFTWRTDSSKLDW